VDLQVTDKLELADCEYILSVVKNKHELADLSPEQVIEFLKDSEVYSIKIDGKIVAFTGAMKPWISRRIVYFLPDPNMPMRSFVTVKNVVKRILEISINNDENINRLEAHVKADCEGFMNFAEKVGFVKESLMKNWGPQGDDYYMYRIIK